MRLADGGGGKELIEEVIDALANARARMEKCDQLRYSRNGRLADPSPKGMPPAEAQSRSRAGIEVDAFRFRRYS